VPTALVLGAGGVVGQAFHVGVLRALPETTGFDGRTADVLVGTSAGSLVAAGLAGPLSAGDLAAELLGEAGQRTRGSFAPDACSAAVTTLDPHQEWGH
jgi:predicted acylesterase/phospholipase RssA